MVVCARKDAAHPGHFRWIVVFLLRVFQGEGVVSGKECIGKGSL